MIELPGVRPRRQCVILAGGFGTRMRPLTERCPKSMLPAAGKPFVDHQLAWLAAEGITDVVFSIGYHGEMIRDYVGAGLWGLRVVYVDEGSELRGTAGALRLASREGALDPAFAVVYGDSYPRVPLRPLWDAFTSSGLPAAMAALRNRGKWDRSNVVFRGGRIVLYDKTVRDPAPDEFEYIDSGVSILTRGLIDGRVPETGPSDLAPLFHSLSREGLLAGFEATQRFYEIGSPQGLSDFEAFLASTPPDPPL
jgi:NDP-sugar pyrophosphorylase family protein